MDKIAKIQELIQQLNRASDFYYNTSTTIMTDSEWDSLLDELKLLEAETEIIFSNSPSINVGYEVQSKLNKVEHSIPLKSLSKTKSIDELKKFMNNKECVMMLKGDGLTCELIYDNGKLIQASTRGNSIIGEEITFNAKTFKNIPLTIEYKGYLKLAGEAVIFDYDFKEINRKENGKFANSRNLVSGSVRQLNSKICASRNVNFMAFNILECDEDIKTVEEQFNLLGCLGFYTIFHTKVNKHDNIKNMIYHMKDLAKDMGIPIDGLVIKFNDLEYGKSLGETSKYPLNAIAFKFENEESETEYIKTIWDTSRTGLLNPVAIFQPVEIDGSVIERATLHNVDYFEELQLGEGDVVTLIKCNEVIPKITGNLTRSNTEKIPTTCPVCGSNTEVRLLKTARVLYCTNDNCPSKKVAQYEHYCSRNAMNILGVSESILETFINKGFIKDIVDLYRLDRYKKEIIRLDGFGVKSYNNIIESIEKSKKCKLANFIFALGVSNVGLETAKLLVKACKNDINNIFKADKLFLRQIDGIGDVVSREIYKYFGDKDNIQIINELMQYVEFEQEEKTNSSNSLEGKIFVITGDVHIFKNRNEIKTKIESCLGKVASSVSSKTNFLINNDSLSGSSKNKKAKELGVKIITEEEFLEMIK